jgi:hypothetical protein
LKNHHLFSYSCLSWVPYFVVTLPLITPIYQSTSYQYSNDQSKFSLLHCKVLLFIFIFIYLFYGYCPYFFRGKFFGQVCPPKCNKWIYSDPFPFFMTFFSDIYFILIYIWFDFEFELYRSFNFCIVSMLKEKFSNHSLYIQVIQSFISLLSSLIDIISIVYQ